MKLWHRTKSRAINGPMTAGRARFHFWYYFPKPLAEEGARVA
ncbi:hypothetical protein [Pseudoxanthomonas taiwanensis]|jgi:hypothetical protein|nr:hypothetical protein [Pseudoxanthomonas taiwanensis]